MGCDYLCRSPNRAKRMECVQLAAAFDCGRTFEWALTGRKRQQAARTPYASRGSVTDTNNRTRRFGADLTRPLKVFYRVSGTASNGVDYRPLSGELLIPQNEAAAAIIIDPIDDKLVE